MTVEGLPHRRGNVGGSFYRLRRRRIFLVDGCDGDRLAYEIRVVVEAPVVAIPGRDDEGNGHLLPVGQLRLALEGGIGLCLDVARAIDRLRWRKRWQVAEELVHVRGLIRLVNRLRTRPHRDRAPGHDRGDAAKRERHRAPRLGAAGCSARGLRTLRGPEPLHAYL